MTEDETETSSRETENKEVSEDSSAFSGAAADFAAFGGVMPNDLHAFVTDVVSRVCCQMERMRLWLMLCLVIWYLLMCLLWWQGKTQWALKIDTPLFL